MTPPARVARRIFRALLDVCGRDLRSDGDLEGLFDEMLDEELTRSGRLRAAYFCARSYMDVLATAVTRRRRDGWMGTWIASIGTDLNIGLRSLRKTPGTTAAAVGTVATSIALTALVLSAIQGALLRPPPFSDGARVMAVDWSDADFEVADFTYLRSRQTAFESVEGYFRAQVTIEGLADYSESLPGAYVTANALEHLGVPPALGRLIPAGEGESRPVEHVVLGFDLWQTRFGGSETVLGRSIRVDGRELEIIGVMPAGFAFPVSEVMWIPMDLSYGSGPGSGRSFSVFGRLVAGRLPDDAKAEAAAIAAQMSTEDIVTTPPTGARVEPFARRHLPEGIQTPLYLMLATVGLVLLVACANLANLLAVRSLPRRPEVALRGALGAGRARLVQQFLIEAALVSLVGTALGLSGAWQSVGFVRRAVIDVPLPYWVDFRLDAPALGLTSLLVVVVALAAGALPAANAARWSIASGLRQGRRGSTSGLGRMGSGLVSAQVALTSALLIAAGLLIRSVTSLGSLDLGYDAEHVLTARVNAPSDDTSDPGAFFLSLQRELETLPGVEQATVARSAPGTGETFSWKVWVEGEEARAGPIPPTADGKNVGFGYFEAMGMDMVEGRDFTPEEAVFVPNMDRPHVVIVNRTFATRHLGPTPIGRRVQFGARDPEAPWFTVVGVVQDGYVGSRSGGIGLPSVPPGQMYIPWGLAPYRSGTLLLRTRLAPEAAVYEVRELLAEMAPGVALIEPARLSDLIEEGTWAFTLFGSVFSLFGLVALVMSAGGLYGIIAFDTARRRRELGVRMVLGASPVGIVGLSVRDGARKLVLGVVAGTGLALVLTIGLRSLVFGVGTHDPVAYSLAIVLVCCVGFLACLVPAWIATRRNPLAALRQE